jgi:hypothetical protein
VWNLNVIPDILQGTNGQTRSERYYIYFWSTLRP